MHWDVLQPITECTVASFNLFLLRFNYFSFSHRSCLLELLPPCWHLLDSLQVRKWVPQALPLQLKPPQSQPSRMEACLELPSRGDFPLLPANSLSPWAVSQPQSLFHSAPIRAVFLPSLDTAMVSPSRGVICTIVLLNFILVISCCPSEESESF